MSLAGYSLPDLRKLGSRIATEIRKREQSSKTTLLKRLTKMATAEGFALSDVLGSRPTDAPARSRRSRGTKAVKETQAPKAPLPPKFRHPNNRELVWSGRGRKPGWVEAWLANGGSMDALAHTASLFARSAKAKRGGATANPEPTAADQGA